jgi:hypothetical protein
MKITGYDDDGYRTRRLATPEEEAQKIKELSGIILGALYSEGALSGKELKNRYGGYSGYSKKLIDMILFAHPNIAKIGNTKSRKYYYTEDSEEGLPWL